EGRNRAKVGPSVTLPNQPVEPVPSHFGIAVEQHHILVACQLHTAIGTAGIAEVPVIGVHFDARPAVERMQVCNQFRFGAAIIDDDYPWPVSIRGGQDALDTALGSGQPLIDANNNSNMYLWQLGQP